MSTHHPNTSRLSKDSCFKFQVVSGTAARPKLPQALDLFHCGGQSCFEGSRKLNRTFLALTLSQRLFSTLLDRTEWCNFSYDLLAVSTQLFALSHDLLLSLGLWTWKL